MNPLSSLLPERTLKLIPQKRKKYRNLFPFFLFFLLPQTIEEKNARKRCTLFYSHIGTAQCIDTKVSKGQRKISSGFFPLSPSLLSLYWKISIFFSFTTPCFFFLRFDLAVNGGGVATLRFQRSPLSAASRSVRLPWNRFAALAPVVMSVDGGSADGGMATSAADGEEWEDEHDASLRVCGTTFLNNRECKYRRVFLRMHSFWLLSLSPSPPRSLPPSSLPQEKGSPVVKVRFTTA